MLVIYCGYTHFKFADLALVNLDLITHTTLQICQISGYIDLFVNFCFSIECVTKICAMGFAMDQGSYIFDTWNRLDFFIVCSSIIDLSLSNNDIPALKILRLLRMLRPLCVISHNVAIKLIVASLFESVVPIANVVIVVVCGQS